MTLTLPLGALRIPLEGAVLGHPPSCVILVLQTRIGLTYEACLKAPAKWYMRSAVLCPAPGMN